MRFLLFLLFTGSVLFLFGCQNKESGSAEEIVTEPETQVELLVSEPLVIDPVAYAFDAQGLLYVVEDRGYPDPAEGGSPSIREGKIALLEDTNGDGRYDTRYEFADDLTYPNGVMAWNGGALVTCAPDIWFFKDTTGDGIADIREIVLTGFHDTKTAQIRTSHPTLGLDGYVYVSSGLNGGDVYSPLFSGRDTVSFTASDGRMNPKTYEFETVGGKSQFGMTFDGYGHRFGVSNRHPVMQVVIEPRYLNRNPYLPYSETVKYVSTVAEEAVVFPLVDVVTTSDFIPNLMGQSHQGTFTAASSSYIYYGKGLAEEHQGNVFICESAQNLMQRQKISQEGAAFRSDLVYEDREFMASEDEWFRPVYVNNGPDDALYVVDMHRKVIDHPSYVPEEVRDQFDFDSGKDMGRIYRITRKDYNFSLADKEWFSPEASNEELVRRLDSDIEWDRETAFRLILENEERQGLDGLKTIVYESAFPLSRIRALWLLHHKEMLTEEILLHALQDDESGIREQALFLAEPRASQNKNLKTAIIETADDPDMHVRLQCALVLGSLDGEEVLSALASLGIRDGDDQWMREAVLSGVGDRMGEYLISLNEHGPGNDEGYSLIMKDMGKMLGAGASVAECKELARIMVEETEDFRVQISSLTGLCEGMTGREEIRHQKSILHWLIRETDQDKQQTLIRKILQAAEDTDPEEKERIKAIQLLGYTDHPEVLEVMRTALRPETSPAVQRAAVQSIATSGKEEGGKLLTESEIWKQFTPKVRSSIVSSMVAHSAFIPILLDAIDEGVVAASDVPSVTRKRLLAHQNEEIKRKAEIAFASLEGGDRMAVYEDYKARLHNEGDEEQGQVVFERSCAVCHSYEGSGGNVGPDLTSIKNQPAEAILLHTVLPNYEVYPSYQTLSVETEDGRHIAGWVVSETENSITLRTAGGTDESVLRSTIQSIVNTGQSLMPDGLEQTMTEEEMNDLIAYLKKGSTFQN